MTARRRRPSSRLAEIKAEIPLEAADATADALFALEDAAWSLREDALARRAWILGILPAAEASARWAALRPRLPVAPLAEASRRLLPEKDWRESYKAHFRAWRCGRLHWVPSWERRSFRLPRGHAALWLDPGMAFGTGNHPTTRLCCERLVALAGKLGPAGAKAARVVDAGCGSGILALSALRLGFRDVSGFDCDPEAVRVSRANAARNRLAGRARFAAADLAAGLAGPPADILLANIQADVLIGEARRLVRAVAPGGTLVLSGILAKERTAVRSAFAAAVPEWAAASRVLGEWCDLRLARP